MAELQHSPLGQLLQEHPPGSGRWARDGGYGGGGGCGGFEVFAFLAFLIALLDLLLDLNNMNNTMGRRLTREVDQPLSEGETLFCSNELDLNEGVWAASQLATGVLQALTSPPACGHAHLCHVAANTATRGLLPATLVRLAGAWLDRWPSLSESELGKITLQAAASRTCPQHRHYNCSKDITDHIYNSLLLLTQSSQHDQDEQSSPQEIPPSLLQSVPSSRLDADPLFLKGHLAIAEQLYNFKKRRQKPIINL